MYVGYQFETLQPLLEEGGAPEVEDEAASPDEEVFDCHRLDRAVVGLEGELVVDDAVDDASYHEADGCGQEGAHGGRAERREYPGVEHEAYPHIGPRRDLG